MSELRKRDETSIASYPTARLNPLVCVILFAAAMNAWGGVHLESACNTCQNLNPDSTCCDTMSSTECNCRNEVTQYDNLKYWCNLNGGYVCELDASLAKETM